MRSRRLGYALIVPFGIMTVSLVVIPVLLFVTYSLLSGGRFTVEWQLTLSNYGRALNDQVFWRLIGNSMLIAGLTTIVSLPVGYLMALYIHLKATLGKKTLLALTVIAITGGYLVRIYAWRIILGTQGVLDSLLVFAGLPSGLFSDVLFSRTAVTIALVNFYIPFVAVLVYASLQTIGYEIVQAARDLGAGAWKTVAQILLPLSGRAVFASFSFVFLLSVADYITPQILGGTNGAMAGVAIYDQFVRLGNWPLGAAMSILLVGVSGSILGLVALAMRRWKLLKQPG